MRLSAAKPRKRSDRAEPVAQADLLPLFLRSRGIADRHLDDPAAARQHFRRELVIELKAGGDEIERRDHLTPKQLQCRDGIGEVTASECEGDKTEALPAQKGRP